MGGFWNFPHDMKLGEKAPHICKLPIEVEFI